MNLTVLTDDKVRKRGFVAEHGLSLYIKHEGVNILFDTGQSSLYLKNAVNLEIDPNDIDYVILSHGHYDHCGGISYLPKLKKNSKIYIQKKALEQKYAINDLNRSYRSVSFEGSLIENEFTTIDGNIDLSDSMTLITKVPNTVAFEGLPQGFFIKTDKGMIADHLEDEQMLVIKNDSGLYVFIGCSHPGIINCLNYVNKKFPDLPIDTVVAGMHLEKVDEKKLENTIAKLIEMDIKHIIPLHCTGLMAIVEMKKALKERCSILYAGDTIDI